MRFHPSKTVTLTGLLDQLHHAPRPRVPELHCPLEPGAHDAAEAIHSRSVAWARAVGLAPTSAAEARLRASKIGWLVARAYPRGDAAMVQIAADWATVFCLLDDRLERLPSPAAVAGYLAELASVLRTSGDPSPRGADGEAEQDPVKRACADLRVRLSRAAPRDWHVRFDARIAELFRAFVLEAEVRAAGGIPALDVYVPMREVTVGIHVETEIGELACGIEIEEPTRGRRDLAALRRMASNIVGWANDLFTFEKELRQGESTNLVMVLAAAEGLDLTDAVARAAERHDDEVRSFIALGADILASDTNEGVKKLVAMTRAWVRGHLDWAHETGRYDPVHAPPAARESAHSLPRAAVVDAM